MKKITLLLTGILIYSFSIAQSPWARQKGDGFSQLSFTTLPEYNLLFQSDQNELKTERYANDNTLQLYNEIGIAKDLNVIVVAPFKMQSVGALSEDTLSNPITKEESLSGIGNVTLGVRKGFKIKKMVAALQLKVALPTYAYDKESGIATGYNATSINALYSLGKGFNEKNYLFGYTGGTFRTNNYSSVAIVGFEYGHKFFDQLWFIPFLDFNFSLRNGNVKLDAEQIANGFYINNQEFTATGFKFIEEFNENIGATFGFGGSFTGNNVAQTPAISIGGYYKW